MQDGKVSVTVSVIGLGNMGRGVARNIIRAGFPVRVYDASEDVRNNFENDDCFIATSVRDAVAGADIVITLLPDSGHVEEVLIGQNGVAETATPGTLFIDMSTICATRSDHIAKEMRKNGFSLIDAPLGRTPRDAEAGTLLVIAGGTDEEISRAKDVFSAISEKMVHVGPRGTAIRLKLINNYMSTVGVMLVAEALALANKAGIDRDKTVEVLTNTTAGRGQLIVNYPKKVLAGDVTPDFPLRLAQKDVSHALTLASENGVPLYLGAIARETFSLAKPWQRGNEDWTAMLLLMEDIAKIEHIPALE